MEIGLSALTAGRRAFINVGQTLLESGLLEALPACEVTLEVLEDVPATPSVLATLERLREAGFQIALDDLVDDPPERRALLALGDVWKVDVLHGITPAIRGLLERRAEMGHRPVLLAEKVESGAAFAEARELGFELFQGYFHGRPETRRSNALPLAASSVLRLVRRLYTRDATVASIEAVLASDAALVVRLLRLVSSPAFGLRRPVTSVHQALVLLGIDQIRRWATVLAIAQLDLARAPEALRRSLVRAKLCMACGDPARADELYLLGLFSLLDTLTGRPISEWAEDLPLCPDARQSLVEGTGPLGPPLRTTIAVEAGDWEALRSMDPDVVQRVCDVVPIAWEEANLVLR
jgi:EAL and modified HD-GYP domain-containing signal transduction protein